MNRLITNISSKSLFWVILLFAAFTLNCTLLTTSSNQADSNSLKLRTYAAASVSLTQNKTSLRTGMKRTDTDAETIAIEYNFPGLNNDKLKLKVTLPRNEIDTYQQDYGYLQSELDALDTQQQESLKKAYQHAVAFSLSQGELNAMSAKIKLEYQESFRSFLNKRGFKFISSDMVVPDMPGIVKRNVTHLKPVALALNQLVEQNNYAIDDIVPTITTLIQTALAYRNIPETIDQRHTAGIYPPLLALTEGVGDCDSKTALLAAILLNWDQIKLIGLGVPDHYLMGIMKNPSKGDLFIEYQGMPYVLIEPAGPAWLPPGTVSEYTLHILNSGDELLIDPLTI